MSAHYLQTIINVQNHQQIIQVRYCTHDWYTARQDPTTTQYRHGIVAQNFHSTAAYRNQINVKLMLISHDGRGLIQLSVTPQLQKIYMGTAAWEVAIECHIFKLTRTIWGLGVQPKAQALPFGQSKQEYILALIGNYKQKEISWLTSLTVHNVPLTESICMQNN